MRGACLRAHGGPQVIEYSPLPVPSPKAGEVRIRIKAAALNHLDLWVRRGLEHLRLQYPHVLGADGAGIIDEVGAGVTGFQKDQSVIIYPALSCGNCPHCVTGIESLCADYHILGESVSGTHAEFLCVPAANLFPKPDSITFEEAAAIPLVFVTAWEMVVNKAQVKAGDWVLIHGAGSGVSGAAIQIASHLKANVIVTSSDETKAKKALLLGAQVTISTATQDFGKEVKRICPKGVDVILDHVGQVFWEKNIKLMKSGGALVTCGATSGFEAKTDLRHLFFRQLRLLGSTMGSRRDFGKILDGVAKGYFRAVIDRSFPLAQARDAHEYLETGKQFGKVLLIP